ncbi:hypothetical protein B566_EDAN004870, partial [Ephemera danica]
MTTVMQPFMDVESSRSYIDEIYSSDAEKCLNALIRLKNSVIGSNRQKGSVVQQGVVPRLMQLISNSNSEPSIRVEATIILGSIAKGSNEHVQALVDMGVIPL